MSSVRNGPSILLSLINGPAPFPFLSSILCLSLSLLCLIPADGTCSVLRSSYGLRYYLESTLQVPSSGILPSFCRVSCRFDCELKWFFPWDFLFFKWCFVYMVSFKTVLALAIFFIYFQIKMQKSFRYFYVICTMIGKMCTCIFF